MQIKLVMNEEHAAHLVHALEVIARCGIGQFTDLCYLFGDMAFTDAHEIEGYLRGRIGLFNNGIQSKHTPEECKVAWDAYQHLRRELAWAREGLDWRTDKREWPEMMQVNFDEPMKTSGLDGAFKTERGE